MEGTREHDLTERQNIWTGPVQEKGITDQEGRPAGQRQSGAGAGRIFLVLFSQSKQDREPLSALALDCLFPTGLTSWSVTLFFNRTIPNILPLCKVMFPGSLLPLRPSQLLLITSYPTTDYFKPKPLRVSRLFHSQTKL